jgi:hypothetical protein
MPDNSVPYEYAGGSPVGGPDTHCPYCDPPVGTMQSASGGGNTRPVDGPPGIASLLAASEPTIPPDEPSDNVPAFPMTHTPFPMTYTPYDHDLDWCAMADEALVAKMNAVEAERNEIIAVAKKWRDKNPTTPNYMCEEQARALACDLITKKRWKYWQFKGVTGSRYNPRVFTGRPTWTYFIYEQENAVGVFLNGHGDSVIGMRGSLMPFVLDPFQGYTPNPDHEVYVYPTTDDFRDTWPIGYREDTW